MTQNQALLIQLLTIAALALVYVVHLYRAAKAKSSGSCETGEKSQVMRLREELDEVKEERDALKRALKSLAQE